MIVFAVGVVITIATYVFAVSRGGGIYVVSYGPMIVGLIAMARGGIDMARARRAGGPAVGRGQAAGQPGFGGPDRGGQGGWQGEGPQVAFQSAGARPGGAPMSAQTAPMSAQTMSETGAQGGWGPAAGRRDRAGMGGSDYAGYGSEYAGYGAASAADTPNAAAPAANWYPDPQNPAMLRWWDGQGWTSHVRPYN